GGGGQASEGGGGFISLPALLGLNGDSAVHGIVLKTAADDDANANAEATAPPSVLLVPRVDIELEIAGEDIHPLPDVLSKMLKYFKGAHFAGEKLILILDTQKITEGYR
ncbi:MAG: hypothetical protein FWG66_14415, partial [Spirochaetes bacterium]|nr:hypothetical protein [Spirochaetota bacterium]